MSKRKRIMAEQKVAIVRRHLVENVPASDLCDEVSDTSRFRQNAEMESPLALCSRITPCQNCSRSEFPHRVIPNLRVFMTWKYPKNSRRAKADGYVTLTKGPRRSLSSGPQG